MASIPVGGLASGLDTNTLIEQLLAIEKRPITLLDTRKVRSQARAAAFQDLNNKLLTLKSRSDLLKDPAIFFARSVTSSTETVATATASPGSSRGTYTLTATALARGSIAAAGSTKAALTDTVATGAGSFQFKLGATGSVVSVSVDATTTLEQLASAVNAKNAGVKATVVNAGTDAVPAWKLTLTSNATGASNDIVIVADGTTLAVANTQTAVDAAFSITGLGSFTRATNSFSDVLDGVTVTLKAGTGSTSLAVDFDKAATQARVQGLLDAYNDVVRAIDVQAAAAVGSDGKVSAGAFTGDIVPRQIRRGLASVIATSLGGAFKTLAEVGITTQKDGTLSLDGAKFQKALTDNASAVSDLFAGTSSTDGIADLLSQKADGATKSVSGTIAVRQDAISSSIKSTQKQIDQALARLEGTERMLRARFTDLEKTILRIQSTGASLLSQLASLSASSTSGR